MQLANTFFQYLSLQHGSFLRTKITMSSGCSLGNTSLPNISNILSHLQLLSQRLIFGKLNCYIFFALQGLEVVKHFARFIADKRNYLFHSMLQNLLPQETGD